MHLTYAGCNLFGQVPSSKELAIDQFQEQEVDADLIDICLGHSITVLLKKDGVYFHGHGLQPRVTHQVTKLEVGTNAELKSVKTCDTSVYVIDQDGGLFVLDFLAKSPTFVPRYLKKEWKPKVGDQEKGVVDKLVEFSPGSTINVGLTESGLVYNFPDELEIDLMEKAKVKKIMAGYEHGVILDTLGNVYTFGNGRRGQLGNGYLKSQPNPTRLSIFDDVCITDISCGGWHTMALSDLGDVYTWGWNSDGQLGLVDEQNHPLKVVPLPQYLPLPVRNLNVTHIAAGGRHSICITGNNIVYAFGCNKFNQLGIMDFEAVVNKPVEVYEVPSVQKVSRIVCGPSSTLIISEDV